MVLVNGPVDGAMPVPHPKGVEIMPGGLLTFLFAVALGAQAVASGAGDGTAAAKSRADCAECPPMVRVPGLPTGGRQPVRPLYVARHETTWREYMAAVREANCPAPKIDDDKPVDPADPGLNDNYPVTKVPVRDYECYLSWLSMKTGIRHRLPTAEEWEHFARAGTTTNYPWGDSLGQNNAIVHRHYDASRFPPNRPGERRRSVLSGRVRPVESMPPNPWGLYDVIGNAREATTEIGAPWPECLKLKDADWCRLVAGRGGNGLWTDSDKLMTERIFHFAHFGDASLGYRPVHD
ncbi:SUMF1/EgtB/PvdO family nonheme iron enzyme [Sphingomonas changnyeongensis]|uniref:SUMF1/EgtB/PvdO family nonheme iron enzyme n=1 Tax=Sphingomonas changnyeongensis TaxID=2698679 RepID=A0A7Z2NWH4_9SPHN|nr:SUMF1/EgtB/PvdO family nonheme iron enzyme [Sphingomonas changnyeongensis]QHL90529.1 SUMF1/EgtB/PvdO family nonheme iron enzyme [Sphingomonas changnyeongensis]